MQSGVAEITRMWVKEWVLGCVKSLLPAGQGLWLILSPGPEGLMMLGIRVAFDNLID